jgi:hypothetical protein
VADVPRRPATALLALPQTRDSGTISAVSYDLAVWEGDRPADDEAGTKFYIEHIVPQIE